MPDVGSATVRNAILALLYLQNEMSQKSETFHVRRLSYIVYNAAKILGPGVKLRAGGHPNFGQKRPEYRHGSPDKCMMPLSYDLEIFPEYLVPKRKIWPKYRPHNPHSNRDIGPRKTQKIGFSPKWRRKLLPVPVFTSHSDSPWSTWSITPQI